MFPTMIGDVPVPYFPALVIYGMLVAIGKHEVIELVDVVIDEDYFDTIENDPDF